MSWDAAFAAQRDEASRGPRAANPATFGEIWNTSWQAAGLDTAFGIGEPWAEAQGELRSRIETAAGMSVKELAKTQGRPLTALDWAGSTQEAQTQELAELAGGLHPDQQEQLKLYLDVPARARAKAAERERQAADVADRTYGLSGHAVGFLAGTVRAGIDPINLGTMFVGGPLRGPLLPMLAREAGLGMAVQAVQEPFIEAGRAELGLDAGLGRAASNIFEAGIANAGLAGLFRGGAFLMRQAMPARLGEAAHAGDAPRPEAMPDLPEIRADRAEAQPARERAPEPGRAAEAAPEPRILSEADLPAALRRLAPADLDAVARLAERDQVVDGLAPEPTSAGRAVHAEAVDGMFARLETAGADVLARFDQFLSDLDTRLRSVSGEPAAREAGGQEPAGGALNAPGTAEPARRRKRERPAKPVSMGRFIAMNGGIKIDGDVRYAGLNQQFVPGVGMVGRRNGRQLDRDLEPLLIAEGYIDPQPADAPPRDIRAEVYDALEREFKLKQPVYSRLDQERVADLETSRQLDQDQRWHDELAAEADSIRARLAEAGIGPDDVHPQDIADAADLIVRGIERDWDTALERVAIQRVMGDTPDLPALAEIADDLPPIWDTDHEVSARTTPEDRGAARSDGEDAGRRGDQGRSAPAREDLPGAGEAGAEARGRERDPALDALGRLAGETPDPALYRARLADLGRALDAAGGDLTLHLDGGDISARRLLDEIKADADAADALKACLGQGGGDA